MLLTKVIQLQEYNSSHLKYKFDYLGHEQAVKFLVNKGANINIVNKIGDTALIRAAGSGDLKNIKINSKLNHKL